LGGLFMGSKKSPKKSTFTFIDLFAGIGGFRLALEGLGGECVFSSDIDENSQFTYSQNFGEIPHGDITKIKEQDIPKHDVLCAGFPCQPFSKGGHRRGFEDTRGTLFFDIARILKYHKPKYFLLENVPNLVTHDDGNTYKVIIQTLKEFGYAVPKHPLILSPDSFGVTVLRKRMYIPGVLRGKNDPEDFELDFSDVMGKSKMPDIFSFISNKKVPEKYYISPYEKKVLQMWDEFYNFLDIKIIGFPIWSEEFGATYTYSHEPEWKQNFIRKNRELYKRNKKNIDAWLKKYNHLDWVVKTHRKFEWQAGTKCKSIYETLIQFRPSGVRAKVPDKFSTLVAMNHPQIVGKYLRRLTPDETKKLQSFPDDYKLHPEDRHSLKQLGDSVNVTVVENVFKKLINHKL
jgi:DNA (cytosine-5)-methyltransferase 1